MATFKFDFSKPVLDLNDNPSYDADKSLFTFKHFAIGALMALVDDVKVSGNTKAEYCALAVQLVKNNTLELTRDKIDLLKTLIGKNPSPLVVGRMYEFLENPEKSDDSAKNAKAIKK